METYFCIIHKQGPLRDPLECTHCKSLTREEALEFQICMTPEEIPEGDYEVIDILRHLGRLLRRNRFLINRKS